ncbi:hypothetical protein OPQ81_001524 [Rhizoctonia solani]|nr:hypothetical protein OPQ81_001524 [Rhizoctonia solani]
MLAEFLTRLFPRRKDEKRILIAGLDYSGKTTLLYRMHLGEIVTTIPTIGFNVETVKAPTSGRRGQLQLTCWDIGGCDKIRPLIRHYTTGMEALIWILDSTDRERLPEAIDELKVMLGVVESDGRKSTNLLPFLILANKQDLKGAMTLDEVRIKMAQVISARPSCAVFATSLISDDFLSTITPAMDWLYDVLRRENLNDCRLENPNRHSQVMGELDEKLNSWIERASKDILPTQFLEAFKEISLPFWDHYIHIRIAYTILRTYGRQKGKMMIFDGIENYIKTSTQTTGRTFHVTMTYFWIQVVHFGIQSMSTEEMQIISAQNEDFCRFLLLNPYVVDGNLWKDYYSRDVMMTPNAKENMVLPDKKPLPSLVARDFIRK